MKSMQRDILERSVAYSLRIIGVVRELNKDEVGRILGRQLLKAGTSLGANIHEAQGAQSKADFIAKMSISHKEARESAYWLRIVQEAKIMGSNQLAELRDETEQLVKIISAILLTAKKNKN
jgi:four helix bundle protein